MQKYIHSPRRPTRRTAIANFGSGKNMAIDKAVLPVGTAESIFNFDFSTGALTEGYGLVEAAEINRAVFEIWTYRKFNFDTDSLEEILMFRAAPSGDIFYVRNGITRQLAGVRFNSTVRAVNYRLYGDDVILLTSATDSMVVWDGTNAAYSVPNAPKITSLTIHFERMFATVGGESNAVWFSRDLDPTNWDLGLDRGGFIQVLDERGKLNKVISFQNFVYILRDFGISRLSAFADQTDFSVSNLFVSSGRIFADTAKLCGDRIIFLASDGLYQFDGISTTRIMGRLDGVMHPSEKSTAAFFNGKYYLSLSVTKDKKSGNTSSNFSNNNAVLVYDVQTGMFSLLTDVCISGFNVCGDRLFGVADGGKACLIEKCGSVFGVPTDKTWLSGEMDFGTEGIKNIKEIHLQTDYPLQLTVGTERAVKEFAVAPTPGGTKININMRGKIIRIGLSAVTERARINKPTVIFN